MRASSGARSGTKLDVEIVLAVVVLALVVWFVSGPLRRSRSGAAAAADERLEDPRVAELEARKEAKYREIRDAELDREQGKLSRADWGRQDADLRREAIEILRELDEARAAAAKRASRAERPAG